MSHPPRAADGPDLDGQPYADATRLAQLGAAVADGLLAKGAFAVRRAHLAPAYVRLLRTLPTTDVVPAPTPAGAALLARLSRLSWRQRGGCAVLALPDSVEEHLRGRSRQAVRTGIRRARQVGVVVAQAQGRDIATALDSALVERDPGTVGSDSYDGPGVLGLVAQLDGQPVGVALVVHDGRTALLRCLVGPRDREHASPVRYLLHTELVAHLVLEGVRAVVVTDVASATQGNRFFAARLGYRPCRIALGTVRRRTPVLLGGA